MLDSCAPYDDWLSKNPIEEKKMFKMFQLTYNGISIRLTVETGKGVCRCLLSYQKISFFFPFHDQEHLYIEIYSKLQRMNDIR